MDNQIRNENRMTIMEQKIDHVSEQVKSVKDDVRVVSDIIKEHVKCEGERYQKLDEKYSGKWVETGIVAIITSLIIAAIVGLFTFFLRS
jgi:uncharacterized membrane-anchored protein